MKRGHREKFLINFPIFCMHIPQNMLKQIMMNCNLPGDFTDFNKRRRSLRNERGKDKKIAFIRLTRSSLSYAQRYDYENIKNSMKACTKL